MSIFLAQIFVIFREGSAWCFWRDTKCRFAGYEKRPASIFGKAAAACKFG